VRLKELQSNQTTLLANTKESERLEAEKHLRNELSALDGKIKELQAAQTVSEQQRLLDVEHAKTELQNQLQGERTKNADLNRNVQGYLVEISNLRETNNALEAEMSKIVRVAALWKCQSLSHFDRLRKSPVRQSEKPQPTGKTGRGRASWGEIGGFIRNLRSKMAGCLCWRSHRPVMGWPVSVLLGVSSVVS
jgi:hypothetical protein